MTPGAPTDDGRREALGLHLANVVDNLQFIADLGYGDVSLAVPNSDGSLVVVADARPMTAVASLASTREGRTLSEAEEPEAYAALERGEVVADERRRTVRGISFVTMAYPVGEPEPEAVVIRNLALQVLESPGKMETVFMSIAEEILGTLSETPLIDAEYGEPFATVRRAGDGVMRIGVDGTVTYASPNSVNIMRLAGIEGTVSGRPVTRLPGAEYAVNPVLTSRGALRTEIEAGDRVIGYRTINLGDGAVVLVEDLTDARRREQELKVKEATIREVHHRVKNNLQTVASLLRIQGRRAGSEEVRRALAEATERVSSMAVVHELLAASTDEQIDFTEAAETVVDMVRRGLEGEATAVDVTVKGTSGYVPAQIAASLALVVAELVHNAIEHGFEGRDSGSVVVEMRRLTEEFVLTVRDDGTGLPEDFDIADTPNLGLEIVRTIVEDDLHGTLSFGKGRGTTITVRFPLDAAEG
jgi:two-component sensor histidine kinase